MMSAALLATLAGCATIKPDANAALSAPLPAFAVGDSFIFDDGTIARVVAVTADQVHWQGSDGAAFVTSRDVLLPAVSWQDRDRTVQRDVKPADGLFPLRVGSEASFDVVQRARALPDGPEATTREAWRCSVPDAAWVRTGAGWFDTARVVCDIADQTAGTRMERTFYYAPTIGFYVRREERRTDNSGGRSDTTAQLTDYSLGEPPLSDDALSRRAAGLQQALQDPKGAPLSWADANGEAEGVITPEGLETAPDGQTCRAFGELIEANARRYRLSGKACSGAGAVWQVVALSPARSG